MTIILRPPFSLPACLPARLPINLLTSFFFFFFYLGGGAGKWSAWKAGEMARRYEAQGGDYKDTGDNKNKAQKGEPEKK